MQKARLAVPFGYTLKQKIDMWNIMVTRFFRKYAYNRLK